MGATLIFAGPAFAEMPLYFATAKTNLKAGTVLSPSNIQMTQATEATAPRNTMWLKTQDQAYGYKTYHDRAKGENLSMGDLKGDDRGNMAPLKTDPMWIQYVKSSSVCMKRNDLATAVRYQQGALAELAKLAAAKKRIDHLGDEVWLSILSTDWELANAPPSKLENLPKKLAMHEQLYAVLSKVMPPTSEYLHELAGDIVFEKGMVSKRRN